MMVIYFSIGVILGIFLQQKIIHAFCFIIKSQIKLFNRQCRIFYLERIKNKKL
jgi:uncharacterized protein YneF (UPF0154 family)